MIHLLDEHPIDTFRPSHQVQKSTKILCYAAFSRGKVFARFLTNTKQFFFLPHQIRRVSCMFPLLDTCCCNSTEIRLLPPPSVPCRRTFGSRKRRWPHRQALSRPRNPPSWNQNAASATPPKNGRAQDENEFAKSIRLLEQSGNCVPHLFPF